MIIDSLVDKSFIDIGDLNFDLPAVERPRFDVGKELDKHAWNNLIFRRATCAQSARIVPDARSRINTSLGNWTEFIGVSSSMGLIFPDREDDFRINNDDWEGIREWFVSEGEKSSWWTVHSFNLVLFGLKSLCPDKMGQLKFSTNDLEAMELSLERAAWSLQWEAGDSMLVAYQFLAALVTGKVIFPGEFSDKKITQEQWEKIKENLQMRENFELRPGAVRFGTEPCFVRSLMLLRLLSSGKEDFFLDKSGLRERLKFRFNEYKQAEKWGEVALFAAALNVLAADEAKITPDGGIEVLMHKHKQDMAEKIPDMPVKRAF